MGQVMSPQKDAVFAMQTVAGFKIVSFHQKVSILKY
jgi:hypothetical protein